MQNNSKLMKYTPLAYIPRHVTSHLHCPCKLSAVIWRLIFSACSFPDFM